MHAACGQRDADNSASTFICKLLYQVNPAGGAVFRLAVRTGYSKTHLLQRSECLLNICWCILAEDSQPQVASAAAIFPAVTHMVNAASSCRRCSRAG